MTATEFLSLVSQIGGFVGIVCSMLAMGMGLTLAQVTGPLKDVRLVAVALLANFVLVPLLAFGITLVIPIDQSLKDGLIIVSASAGAPFLIMEARGAKASLALAVGVMTLLMVVTIFYLPLVLPLLLSGVDVDPWEIAQSLIVLMLIPLALGMLVKAQSPETASEYAPSLNKIGGLGIMILLVVGLALNLSNVISVIGTAGFLALALFIVGSLLIGYVLGGKDESTRIVLGLGTSQRNVSAAIVIALTNFTGTLTVSYVLVAGILIPIVLFPTAGWIGKRRAAQDPSLTPAPSVAPVAPVA
jgi:predicted Na+-dependent transporter